MTPKSFFLSPELHRYVVDHGAAPDEIQQGLIDETAALGSVSGMQIAPEQGQLLTLLTSLVGARSAVEVGTFTGYSSLAIARALPDDGHLLCCDISDEWTSIARTAWEAAGVADRIDLRLAPALETLQSLPLEAVIDFAFIDADKGGYQSYYDELLPRLRPNGLIAVDNTLWSGDVLESSGSTESDTLALRAFNDAVTADDRVETVLLTVGDGLTIIRKR